MGALFSRKAPKQKSRITQHDEAILQLKSQRDKLKQYQRRIESNVEREREIAKELLRRKHKERALLLLKKKRFQEQLIETTLKQMDNIERMIHDVEFTQIQMRVMDGLKLGNECLHQMHAMFSIEDVEKLMEETKEAVEYQREIDALVSGQFTETDLQEVEEEFENLVKDIESPEFPAVPADKLPARIAYKPVPGQEKTEKCLLEAT